MPRGCWGCFCDSLVRAPVPLQFGVENRSVVRSGPEKEGQGVVGGTVQHCRGSQVCRIVLLELVFCFDVQWMFRCWWRLKISNWRWLSPSSWWRGATAARKAGQCTRAFRSRIAASAMRAASIQLPFCRLRAANDSRPSSSLNAFSIFVKKQSQHKLILWRRYGPFRTGSLLDSMKNWSYKNDQKSRWFLAVGWIYWKSKGNGSIQSQCCF